MNFVNYGLIMWRDAKQHVHGAQRIRRWQFRGKPLGKANSYPHELCALFDVIKGMHHQALHNAFTTARRSRKSGSVKHAFDVLTLRLNSVVPHNEDYTWYAYAKQCAIARRRALKRLDLLAPKIQYPVPPAVLCMFLNSTDIGGTDFNYALNILTASFRYHWGH